MTEIDPITGLPKELMAWENITKESQKITIKIEKKKFGKKYTIVQGIDEKEVNIKDLVKKLKNRFACGGTAKKESIELQGVHLQQTKDVLVEMGFSPQAIEIKKQY